MSDNKTVYTVGPNQDALHCDNCEANVMRVSGNEMEPDNALWVKCEGGYGQFIDPLPDMLDVSPRRTDPEGVEYVPFYAEWTDEEKAKYEKERDKLNTLVLCHECSHKLCELFPAFQNLLHPHNSHAHTDEYHKANPDHWGWDYDYRERSRQG